MGLRIEYPHQNSVPVYIAPSGMISGAWKLRMLNFLPRVWEWEETWTNKEWLMAQDILDNPWEYEE